MSDDRTRNARPDEEVPAVDRSGARAVDAPASPGDTAPLVSPDPGDGIAASGTVRAGLERTTSSGALERTALGPGVLGSLDRTVPGPAGGLGLDVAQTAPWPGAPPPAPQSAPAASEGSATEPDATRTLASVAPPVTTGSSATHGATAPGLGVTASPGPSLRPFGPYSRVETLAQQGSVGVVARGYNEEFGRWELLKFLREDLASNAELVRQFRREGRVLAQLSHPNVVQVFATHDHGGRASLAMEFLEGESLETLIQAAPRGLDVARATELFLEAARGLAAAHEVGLLHRDLKPENLFVAAPAPGRSGGLKLIDFGLATLDRHSFDRLRGDASLLSGTVGGTPLFMAPELWRGREATPATDLFALGLTFFQALTGRLPFVADTLDGVREAMLNEVPFPSVRSLRPEVPPKLAALVDGAIAKEVSGRPPSAAALVTALVAAQAAVRPRRLPGSGPYRGLGPYSAAERDVFFGRDREVAEIVERLRSHPALVLVGQRGVGKTSLLEAGVVPAITDGALGSTPTSVAIVRPAEHPLAALARAVAPWLGEDPATALTGLQREPTRLPERLRAALGAEREGLIVVDPLEAIATQARDPTEVADFVAAIGALAAAGNPGLRLLATVRTELVDALFAHAPLRALMTRGFYPVQPLAGDALRTVLVEPAATAGYELEDPSLIASILAEVERTPAALPLLSFALAAWWQARDEARRVLPVQAWRDLGGVAGALVRHAEGVLATMSPDERASAERLLVRLVSAERTRAAVPRAQLEDPASAGAAAGRALERLLTAQLAIEQGAGVVLVHDALLRDWPRLDALLASAGEDRALRARLVVAATEWEAQQRADGALWDGAQARRLLEWFDATEVPLGQLELGFVAAVRRRVQRRRFRLRAALGFSVAAAVLGGGSGVAQLWRLEAELSRARTDARAATRTAAVTRAGLLEDLARQRSERDPAGALSAAAAAHSLEVTPGLDPLAWRIRAAGVPRPLPAHAGGASRVAWSPGSARIATGGENGELRLVAARGGEVRRLAAPTGVRVSALAFSPDGGEVAWGTGAGQLRVARRDGRARPLGSCDGDVVELRWLDPARLVARCRSAGRESLQWLEGGATTPGARGAVLALSSHGDRVAASQGATLEVRRPSSDDAPLVIPLGRSPTAMAFTARGDGLLLGAAGGYFTRLSLASDRAPPKIEWRSGPQLGTVRLVSEAPDGARWVSIDDTGSAVLWSANDRPLATFAARAPLARWLPERGALALAGRDLRLILVATDTGAALGHLAGATAPLTDLGASDDGEWLIATAADGGVRAYALDEATARALPVRGVACAAAADAAAVGCWSAPASLALSPAPGDARVKARTIQLPPPDGAVGAPLVAVAPVGASALLAWDDRSLLTAADRTTPLAMAGSVGALASGHGEPIFAVATRRATAATRSAAPAHGEVRLVEGGALRWTATLAEVPRSLAFSPDDRAVAVGTGGGDGLLLERASGRVSRRVAARHGIAVGAIAVASDGQLALGDEAGGVFAAAPAVTEAVRVDTAAGPVRCLAWAREGRGLLVGTATGSVSLLDVETGAKLPLFRRGTPVVGCARSEREDRFLVTFADGVVWQRRVDLDPIWLGRPATDALAPADRAIEAWRGLDPVGDDALRR